MYSCKMAVHNNFILESKMVELYQNQNSKQPDRPDAVYKFLLWK